MKQDYFRSGFVTTILALWYGNIDACKKWHQKSHQIFDELDLPRYGWFDQTDNQPELATIMTNVMPAFATLGLYEEMSSLMRAVGYSWDKDGLGRIDYWEKWSASNSLWVNNKYRVISYRLLVFLSAPSGTIDDAEVEAFMPSPQELADIERGFFCGRIRGQEDLPSFGARAFLKLGRDDDAYELSKIAVSPKQKSIKKGNLMTCHSILGQVAAKRGHLEEAEGHFANALKEAQLSRLPMLELLAARDWKKHLLEPYGRDVGVAEAVIDGACAKMKKTREQLEVVLLGR